MVYKAFSRLFINGQATDRFACSKAARIWLFGKQQVEKENFHVIPNAIQLERFLYSEEKRHEMRTELGIGEKELAIVCVARFSPQKNHTYLLQVFQEIQNRKPESKLYLVGQGELEQDIRDQVARLGLQDHVKFLGSRSDVGSVLTAMDAFLFPSFYEGFGTLIIEAQCSALPMLASDSIRYFYCFDTLDYQRSIVRECCVLPFVCTLLAGIVVNVLSWRGVIQFEFDSRIMTMLAISVFFQVINRIDLILLRVTYQTKLYSMLQVMTKILFAGIAIAGCFLLQTQMLFVLTVASAVSYGVVTVVGINSQKELWNFKKIRQRYPIDRKELYHYAFPFIVSMGITTIFQGIDKISLNRYCSYEEVGIYSSAITLVHVFAIVQTTFAAIWSPMVVEHYEKEPEDRTFYQKGFRTMSFVMFFIGISLILCKDMFVLLLGEDYRGSAAMIPFLCLSPIMLTISDITVIGITFSKKSYLQIIVVAVACAANIMGNTLLVPIMGGIGAAISTGLSYIIFFAMRTFLSNRYFPMKWDVGKFSIIVLLFLAYAWYNTFHSFGAVTVLGYVMILAIIVCNYQDIIRDGYHLLKKLNLF